MNQQVVTLVRVKTPWYGFQFLLKRGFRKAIPTYAAIEGLLFKYFTYQKKARTFGGIYLWRSKAEAEKWYNEKWFALVRTRYGAEAQLEYFTVTSLTDQLPKGKNYDTFSEGVAVIGTAPESPVNQAGILRTYDIASGNVSMGVWLFRDHASARAFLQNSRMKDPLIFEAPVLLDKQKTTTPSPQ